MKVRLPFIGQVSTGKDTQPIEKVVEKLVQSEMSAAFLDLSSKGLTDYKTVSDRLLTSFNGWVYANVSVLAEEISKMEFELYKTVMKEGKIELVKVDMHPILDLLDRFNPFTTTSQAMYLIECYIELAGDSFIVLDGTGANINNLFLLQPDKVTVVPGDVNDQYMVKKYVYEDTVDGKKVSQTYEPDQILQIKTPNPTNPYRGKSVAEASAMDIDTDNLAQEMIKMFFKNGAVPSFALSSEQRIGKDDIARLEKDLKKTYGGVRNAFKALILGNGLKPVSVQQNAKEMQFLEIETAMRDKIMAMFKNTKSSLGIVEDVNRANAEASMLNWKQSVIKPKMQRIVDTFNEFLVPRYGDNLVLSFVDPVPENRDAKITEATKLSEANIITRNEARSMLGYDEVKGGDEFTPETSPKDMPEPIKRIDYRKHFRNIGLYERYNQYQYLYKKAQPVAKAYIDSKKKAVIKEVQRSQYFTNEQIGGYYKNIIHLVDVKEADFKKHINNFINSVEEKAIHNLPKAIDKRYKVKTLFDYDEEVQLGVDLFTPLQTEIAKLSALEANALLDYGKGYMISKDLEKTIKSNVKLFTQSMLSTDRDKLTAILDEGIKQGHSIGQISASIREEFEAFRKSQTDRIARSEILRASNAGAVDAWTQSGVVSGKQWLTDSNPCEFCAPLEGKIIDLDTSFFDKGDRLQNDGKSLSLDYDSVEEPPLHPNCECTVIPVLKDIRELDNKTSVAKKK